MEKPLQIMLIAGEPSGDMLGAGLVQELRGLPGFEEAVFFGAGGERMAKAGVDLAFDLTRHSVIGLIEVIRKYGTFRRLFRQLARLAETRRPDVVVGIDFGAFNLRLARRIRELSKATLGTDSPWRPRLVQYVSPQVWASRPGRARVMEEIHDLLLSILPFEKEWYARHAPSLRVEFVGHPVLDRVLSPASNDGAGPSQALSGEPLVLLLPGSRHGEITRHLPVLLETVKRLRRVRPLRAVLVTPSEATSALARQVGGVALEGVEIRVGGLGGLLGSARLALVSTGTVTLECACAGVPTVAVYKTSWSTYQIGKRLVTVPYLAMPNLLAGEVVMPEFIQTDATPERLERAAAPLLGDDERWKQARKRLLAVAGTLGSPGASRRAAAEIRRLVLPG